MLACRAWRFLPEQWECRIKPFRFHFLTHVSCQHSLPSSYCPVEKDRKENKLRPPFLSVVLFSVSDQMIQGSDVGSTRVSRSFLERHVFFLHSRQVVLEQKAEPLRAVGGVPLLSSPAEPVTQATRFPCSRCGSRRTLVRCASTGILCSSQMLYEMELQGTVGELLTRVCSNACSFVPLTSLKKYKLIAMVAAERRTRCEALLSVWPGAAAKASQPRSWPCSLSCWELGANA